MFFIHMLAYLLILVAEWYCVDRTEFVIHQLLDIWVVFKSCLLCMTKATITRFCVNLWSHLSWINSTGITYVHYKNVLTLRGLKMAV